ncbi:hypothetical protein HID58_091256 [Brassica napus]|uniref:BnaA05g13470D protein n=2 Tax=Brassica napus TaxID=3708 RepID=A0A078F579_BRANA|nr:hypothetical protein HID58_091256 [Brassica napus]CAF2097104.1 unnamed protein product [Brassica napus]CDY08272.1 BnaA05g13470D [Brassica napus]
MRFKASEEFMAMKQLLETCKREQENLNSQVRSLQTSTSKTLALEREQSQRMLFVEKYKSFLTYSMG